MTNKLLESERIFRELDAKWLALMEQSPNRITFLSLEGNILSSNIDAPEVSSESSVGKSFLEIAPNDQQDVIREVIGNVSTTGGSATNFQSTETCFDGETTWWSNEISGIVDNGEILGYLIIGTDVTKLKRSEEELRKVNRALSVLSQCSQAIVRSSEKQGLLKRICDIIVDEGNYSLAWVGFTEADDEKTIRIAAQSGAEGGYLEKIKVTWADNDRGRGPAGKAIRTERPAVVKDIQTDPDAILWREEVSIRKYGSMLGLPLKGDNGAFGTLCIYAPEAGAFDDEEVKLLAELADNLAFAIVALRARFRSKMAEEALEVSEGRYREMFENNPHPMWVYDKETLAFLDVNNAAISHYGFTRNEFLSMTIDGIRPAENVPQLLEEISRISSGINRPGVRRHVKKNGILINVEVTTHTLTYGGRPAKLVLANDITDQLEMEILLVESEEKFRIAFRTSPDSITINRLEDDLYIDINDGFTSNTGYTREDAIGKTTREIDVWTDRVDRRKFIEKLEKDGIVHNYEAEFLMKDGIVKTGLMSSRVITLGGEKCVLSVTRDITNIKQVENILRKSEAKYRDLFEESQDVIFICTPEGKILDINPAGTEMFGTDSLEELLSLDITNKLFGKSADRVIFETAMENDDSVKDFEVSFKRKDGKSVITIISATAVRDSEGTIVAYRGSIRDVTESRRLRDQLFQAQKLETIGTLAGGIAHDFNNILTPIFGHISMAISKLPEESDACTNLDQVIKAAERARELVKQILTFNRTTDQENSYMEIYLIVKEALKLLCASLPTNIEIQSNIDENCGTILANPTQVHQIVMNLCTNAHQAMKPEGGILEVILDAFDVDEELASTVPDLSPGSYARLAVSDTGHGMDSETIGRIFEPFFSTRKQHDGTGLGLSVVHGIVGGLDGAINIKSEPGQGSTFTVYIPKVVNMAATTSPEDEGSYSGSEHILFVDDEEEITQVGKDFLEALGYTVTVTTNSLKALETFSGNPDWFDIVITDQMMPNMTGLDLARELKNIKPGVPVIITTGYSEEIAEDNLRKKEIDGFVMKPYLGHNLGRAIRNAVDGDRD